VNATEVGAAINIGPNGVRILDTLGFDRSLAGSMPVGATKVYDDKGNLVLENYPNYSDRYGADWLFHHRSDLRNEFVRLATVGSEELGIGGRPAEVGGKMGV
jgi:salicylate hydroxylase